MFDLAGYGDRATARLVGSTAYDLSTMPQTDSPAQRIVAIVPVGALEGAKSRLGGTLDAEERRELAIDMLDRTVRAALDSDGIDETLVVSPDREGLTRAASAGARTLLQRSPGLNPGIPGAPHDPLRPGSDARGPLPDCL